MTKFEYEQQVEELLDSALNELTPRAYSQFLDDIRFMIEDREVETI